MYANPKDLYFPRRQFTVGVCNFCSPFPPSIYSYIIIQFDTIDRRFVYVCTYLCWCHHSFHSTLAAAVYIRVYDGHGCDLHQLPHTSPTPAQSGANFHRKFPANNVIIITFLIYVVINCGVQCYHSIRSVRIVVARNYNPKIINGRALV